jgi:seryl-tRNA synthetase
LIAEKTTLDKSKKEAEDKAIAVENERDRKIRTIGNYVHDSVPVSQTEVRNPCPCRFADAKNI